MSAFITVSQFVYDEAYNKDHALLCCSAVTDVYVCMLVYLFQFDSNSRMLRRTHGWLAIASINLSAFQTVKVHF